MIIVSDGDGSFTALSKEETDALEQYAQEESLIAVITDGRHTSMFFWQSMLEKLEARERMRDFKQTEGINGEEYIEDYED
jgi:hypothetical protein